MVKYERDDLLSSSEDDLRVRDGGPGNDYDVGPARKKRKTTKSKSAKAPSKSKAQPKLPVVARVVLLATAIDPNAESEQAKERLSKVDQDGLARVKKALALASHVGTGEAEAKAALRMASKYMQKHNISQADVIAAETDEQKFKRAGQSVVAITHTKGLSVRDADWVSTLAGAISIFFPCKSYSTAFRDEDEDFVNKITHTFYGLADLTAAAAQAFEMIHNLVLTWAALNKEAKGRTGKNAYCHGVAEGLRSLAWSERKAEEEKAIMVEQQRLIAAKKAEAQERQKQLDRLQSHESEHPRAPKIEDVPDESELRAPTSTPTPRIEADAASEVDSDNGAALDADSDDDGEGCASFGGDRVADFYDNDDVDDLIDLDAPIPRVKPEPRDTPIPPPLPELEAKEKEDDEPVWHSHAQLIRFNDDAVAIADQFLASSKDEDGKPMKLHAGRKRSVLKFDANSSAAYRKGKEDAKNIDVKRRRIEAAQD